MTATWMGALPMEQSLLRQLIAFAKAGNAEAFERIIVLNERMVLRVAQRLLLNAEDAQDAAQEVFLRLHRNLKRFDECKDLGAWLYRMTVNICRDRLRRSKPHMQLDLVADSLTASGRNPEETVEAAQQYSLVLAALAGLTPREREAIVLRDLEGNSTEEVAAILGSSETTVRSQLSTGRAKMRTALLAQTRKSK
jgi:RNA polymerase sigma-70 factor, ECF subfamily